MTPEEIDMTPEEIEKCAWSLEFYSDHGDMIDIVNNALLALEKIHETHRDIRKQLNEAHEKLSELQMQSHDLKSILLGQRYD